MPNAAKRPGKGGLTAEQNQRLREAIERLLPRYERGQSELAPLLGIEQSTLAGFLLKRQGSSFPVAEKVAELLPMDIYELLGKPRPPLLVGERTIHYEPRYASFPDAAQASRVSPEARALGDAAAVEAVIADVYETRHDLLEDPGFDHWQDAIRGALRRRKHTRKGPPEERAPEPDDARTRPKLPQRPKR